MKEKYTTPEIEIIEFEEEVNMLTPSNNGDMGDNFGNMDGTGWE